MRYAAARLPADVEESEAYRVMCSMGSRRSLGMPSSLLAGHVDTIYRGAGWPVMRAAMEGLRRRTTSARREELCLLSRPCARQPLGVYRVGRRRQAPPAHVTLLAGLGERVQGSCGCADFRRSSLGLCKHLLAVLRDLAGRVDGLSRARSARSRTVARSGPRLVWDPVRPLEGAGDWLERVAWLPGAEAEGAATPWAMRRWFESWDGGRVWRPRRLFSGEPGERLALVLSLERLLNRQPHREQGALPHDPAVTPLLARERGRLERRLAGQAFQGELDRGLDDLRLPLLPYQRHGVSRFLAAGRLLLADDMGLGKTIQAVAACHVLFRAGTVQRGLVVVPASLKSQWLREWRRFCDDPVMVVEGNPARRAATYASTRRGFLIANYEQVLRDLELMHRWAPDLMVLDEAQRIKNRNTKTATFIKELQPPWRLVLTGTPLENRLDELASIMEWVDRRPLEPVWRLVPWHALRADGQEEIMGVRRLRTLRGRLAGNLERRLRIEVLEQLPPRSDATLAVGWTSAQRSAHAPLEREVASILARTQWRPLFLAEFNHLMQLLTLQRLICNGLAQRDFCQVWPGLPRRRPPDKALLRSLHSPKLERLRGLVSRVVLEDGHKLVLFSQWRRMLKLCRWVVADLLESAGLRSVFFTGEESLKRRTHNIIDFHDDPATRLLLCTDAGGLGLNLQRAASQVVNLELPWNPAILEQRIGRVQRMGQRRPVQVHNLVCSQGIEARIATLLSDKQALFSGLLDSQDDEVHFHRSGSFIQHLVRLVEPVQVPDLGSSGAARRSWR